MNLEEVWDKHWETESTDMNFSTPWAAPHKVLLDKYLAKFNLNAVVVNAGCGLGQWIHYCYIRGFNSTGLDIGKKTIKRLNKRLPHIKYQLDDIRDIQTIKDNTCDLIFSFGVIEHFIEDIVAVRQFYKKLKPGGIAIITVPNLYSVPTITEQLARLLGKWTLGRQKHYTRMSLRDIIGEFKVIEEGTLITTELFGHYLKSIPGIKKLSLFIERHSNTLGFVRYVVLLKENK